MTRNPSWSRDELILALDVYFKTGGNPRGKRSCPDIQALSALLNKMGDRLAVGEATYRNPNGCYMKIMNFRRFDSAYASRGAVGLRRGGALEEDIWNEFSERKDVLHEVANAIEGAVLSDRDWEMPPEAFDDEVEATEGAVLTRIHKVRERKPRLVKRKKDQALRKFGKLACEACGFDFAGIYGDRGKGFIEAHHTKPLIAMASETSTKLKDLALLCSNCHRMVHRSQPWLTMAELRALLK